jgi:DNA gyrase subunit A
VADDPCVVYLSSTGLLARTGDTEEPGRGGGRTKHDVLVSAVRTTARGQVGALTSRGRLVKLDVLDLPTLPGTANHPHLQGGAPVTEFLPLEPGERVLSLTSLATDTPGYALGTRQGVVKRVNAELLARDDWELIRLADGDEVVGAVELRTGDEELCFVTSDAQLLHFEAGLVRPQGRAGGGVAGVRLAPRQTVVAFTAFVAGPDAVVVTVSGSGTALPGTEAGSVKVTPLAEYPAKGRATGGVRAHRFLKGESTLLFAWAGPGPARAAAASGAPVELPEAVGRRDGSGEPASQPIVSAAGPA